MKSDSGQIKMNDFKRLSSELSHIVEGVSEAEPVDIEYEDLVSAVGSIVKIFSWCQEKSDSYIALNPEQFTATDAARMITALMRAQNLNAFDITLWLAQTDAKY